jgi:hypothetical protein
MIAHGLSSVSFHECVSPQQFCLRQFNFERQL